MSHERVLKTLLNLGLSHMDAEVYMHLAVKGPQKAEEIGDALKLQEQLLNESLENLKGKVTSPSAGLTGFRAIFFPRGESGPS